MVFPLVPGQNVVIDSSIAMIDDTLSISFHQPKSRNVVQSNPVFHVHDDTIKKWIDNDVSLYRYYPKNDSSIWIHGIIELSYGGIYELSVSCVDTFNLESALSEPFLFMIGEPPSQPIDINLIIKRKR